MRYFAGTFRDEQSSGIAQSHASFGVNRPLLSGFSLRFLSGDRHLKRFGVFYDSSNVYAMFGDKTPNDHYSYFLAYEDDVTEIAHFNIPEHGNADVGRGKVRVDLPEKLDGRVPVLHGFRMGYPDKDHHIDRIRIEFSNKQIKIDFNDKDNKDKFAYAVSYGLYDPALFVDRGTFQRKNVRGRQSFVTNKAGRSTVLTGFDLDFRKNDHHIQEVSVYGGEFYRSSVEYRDHNGDDRFDFAVHWARLR